MLRQTFQTGILDPKHLKIKIWPSYSGFSRCKKRTVVSSISWAIKLCWRIASSVSLIMFNYLAWGLIRCFLTKWIMLFRSDTRHWRKCSDCHRLSYILPVHKVYHLSRGVTRCRIYTGLSIDMSIGGHLASIIQRINAIFQRWIPGNDSFQINGGKRNMTLLGER